MGAEQSPTPVLEGRPQTNFSWQKFMHRPEPHEPPYGQHGESLIQAPPFKPDGLTVGGIRYFIFSASLN